MTKRINIEKTRLKYEEAMNRPNSIVAQKRIFEEADKIFAKYGDYDIMSQEDNIAVLYGKENIVWEEV